MAMTKKEQAAMQAAIDRADRLAALRWTQPVKPDVPPPASGMGYSDGWTFNAYSKSTSRRWSTCVTNGDGTSAEAKANKYRSGSQGAVSLYSTEALAPGRIAVRA